jgi:hypothetical protein
VEEHFNLVWNYIDYDEDFIGRIVVCSSRSRKTWRICGPRIDKEERLRLW